MIHYSSERLGTLVIKQGESKYKVQIRRGNCLAVFIYVYKNEKNPEEGKYIHQLYSFFNDEQHMKNIIKNVDDHKLFGDDVVRVELNTYYKEAMTIAKYMARCGYRTILYYKEPKEKK